MEYFLKYFAYYFVKSITPHFFFTSFIRAFFSSESSFLYQDFHKYSSTTPDKAFKTVSKFCSQKPCFSFLFFLISLQILSIFSIFLKGLLAHSNKNCHHHPSLFITISHLFKIVSINQVSIS